MRKDEEERLQQMRDRRSGEETVWARPLPDCAKGMDDIIRQSFKEHGLNLCSTS